MRPSGPSYTVTTDTVGTVDTSWTVLPITPPSAGDLFQTASHLGTVNVRSSAASGGATQLTLALTEDEDGDLPITNPGLTGSTQTLGTSPGGVLVASWEIDVLLPLADKIVYVWVKADVGEFDNVYAVITWRP